MKKKGILYSLIIVCAVILCMQLKNFKSKAGNNDTLLGTYGNAISMIGNCASLEELKDQSVLNELKKHYNSIVLGNQTKPDFLLNFNATVISTEEGKQRGYYIPSGYSEQTVPAFNFNTIDQVMKICKDNGFKMRIHTLLWHAQTPDWFFREGYSKNGNYVSKDMMNKRMEYYIKTVVNHIQTNENADIVYAYDVVNEYLHASNSGWQAIYGNPTTQSDMVKQAFTYAYEALEATNSTKNVHLFYNDYNTYMEADDVVALISYINKDKKICAGIGMQSHLSTDFPSVKLYGDTIDKFAKNNLEIQITELDVGNTSEDVQASYMYDFMKTILQKKAAGANITSLTYWGYCDSVSWRRENSPLIFSNLGVPKKSYYQVLAAYEDTKSLFDNNDNKDDKNDNNDNNDDSNDNNDNNDNSNDNNDNNSIDGFTEEDFNNAQKAFSDISYTASYKDADNLNPIVTQRFGADPGAMVYNDTLYVVTTNDTDEFNGTNKENTYSKITSINLWSSKDLINWTDHGTISVAGQNGIAKWAGNSWAPAMCHKKINGSEKFFIYFANNANGIGVLEADSPTGPWTDPIGKALIDRNTPNCSNVAWLFDPAVLVDDDGSAYLYFGGGINDNQYAEPKTARVVKLTDNMTGIDGSPVEINAPYLFEDSGINKIGDKYYYSYCSNFNAGNNQYGISNGSIEYCVSDSPMGPFTYAGEIFKNPGTYFGTGGNNHHSIVELSGSYYLLYHTQVLQDSMGLSGGYRSTQIDAVTIDNGTIKEVKGTLKGSGINKPKALSGTIQAETLYRQAGINVRGEGNTKLTDIQKGDWSEYGNVDLSSINSTSKIVVKTSSNKDGFIKITTDKPDNKAIGYVKVTNSSGRLVESSGFIDGSGLDKANLIFVYSEEMEVDEFSITSAINDNNTPKEDNVTPTEKPAAPDEETNPSTADLSYVKIATFIIVLSMLSMIAILRKRCYQR
ncbi:MAG: endo-1,4-beta-xylanase [Lachnospiraceae bacterium]|nr:endo-1,4-beta-xylanase [Lachnospiraceae bacterium]